MLAKIEKKIDEIVSSIFDAYKNNIFLFDVESEKTLTYNEVKVCSLELVKRFQENLPQNARIAIIAPNSFKTVCVYMACLLGNYTIIPISPVASEEEKKYFLALTQADILIAGEENNFLSPQKFIALDSIAIDDLKKTSINAMVLPKVLDKNIFSITFTSGTTEKPKGVCHTAFNILHNSQFFCATMKIESSDRFLHILPMSYMAGFLNNIWCPFVAGASVALAQVPDPFLAFNFWKIIEKSRTNVAWLPPSFLRTVLQVDRDSQSNKSILKAIFSATAPLSEELKHAFEEKYNIPIYASYGMSETLINSIQRKGNNAILSVGEMLVDNHARISSDGELQIKTPALMVGYLNPETSLPNKINNSEDIWFSTGDLAVIDHSRCLHITGRQKDLLIRGGKKFSPVAIEDIFKKHHLVKDIVILGVQEDGQEDDTIVAIVIPNALENWEEIERVLKSYALEHLEVSARPSLWYKLTNFPTTGPTSKLDRKTLHEQFKNLIKGC